VIDQVRRLGNERLAAVIMMPHSRGAMTISHSSTAHTLAARWFLPASMAEAEVAPRSGDFPSIVAAMIATLKMR